MTKKKTEADEPMTAADLIQDEHNYRKHSETNKKRIRKSIDEAGLGRSVVVDADGVLIAGNGVASVIDGDTPVRVIETDGTELVVVKRTDLHEGDERRKKLAMGDNAAGDEVEWDMEAIEADGWEQDELQDWGVVECKDEGDQKQAQEDNFDPDKPVETVCKKGDIWKLGNHRLMCGDSTDAGSVALLMDGEKADMVFTSPPYNAAASMPLGNMSHGGVYANKKLYSGYKDNLSSQDYVQFCSNVLDLCFENTNGFIFWNVNYNAKSRFEYIEQIVPKLPYLIEQICWHKCGSIPFKGSLKRIWEPIYIFSTNGETLHLSESIENYWHISNLGANKECGTEHNACYPVELVTKAMNLLPLSTKILDPFGGTGTTLIAAEQLNRKCYMMELDPHYCDVIIARWEKLTGNKAEKLK